MDIINKQTTHIVRHPQTQQSSLYQQWPERARANQEPRENLEPRVVPQ